MLTNELIQQLKKDKNYCKVRKELKKNILKFFTKQNLDDVWVVADKLAKHDKDSV